MRMQQPRGVLVLLSLVILAVIVTAGLVLGTVIVRDVRQSTISDKGVTALYASETAAEESMYRVLKLNEDPSTLTTSGSLSNGSSWTRETKKTDRQFIVDFLPQNATTEINLYNLSRANQSANVESMTIDWSSGLNMRVELFEWNGTALTSIGVQSTPSCASAPCQQISLTTPVATKAYLVQITAQGKAITDLKVSVFDANGDPVQVTVPVTVVSTGAYKGAKQAIELRLPTPAPWNGGVPPPPPGPVCGNGTVESGETCDDSNTTNGDGCSSTCQTEGPPVCGNGLLQGAEFCDDGDATNLGICNATCSALTYCGDGTVQSPNGFAVGETCDDGNTVSWDGCHKDCRNEAPNLAYSYVSHTSSCSDAPVTLQLTNNTGDPGMALGNYSFNFIGPVCSYINFTTNATIASSAAANSGADDPTKRFFYISEQNGFGCSPHTLQIYDRELHVARTAYVANPCSQINYSAGSYNPKGIAATIAAAHGWGADPATYLQFDYVSVVSSCSDAFVTLKLVGNAADTSMALGNYTFELTGPVCNYINFTDSSLVPSVVNATGAGDPNWRFVYISEQPGFGCSPHTMQIYDRQTDSIRTANISSPCTQINYTPGAYNPKQVAANIAAANGW